VIPSRAFLVTIGAQSFELSEELSEPVRLAIPEVIERIKAILSGISLPSDGPRDQAAPS